MVEIIEMEMEEIVAVLQQVEYAHLACAVNERPYIVPIHFVYSQPYLYIFTSEGKKTDMLARNSQICMQVEDVRKADTWRSVIVEGRAERLNQPESREEALALIRRRNPSLTPAKSRTWKDKWGFERVPVIYRIQPEVLTGRKTSRRTRKRRPR